MPTNNRREHARVHNAQSLDPIHAQRRVDNAALPARSHARGARGVVQRLRRATHAVRERGVVARVQCVVERGIVGGDGVEHVGEGGGVRDAGEEAQGAYEHGDVVRGGEVLRVDDGCVVGVA